MRETVKPSHQGGGQGGGDQKRKAEQQRVVIKSVQILKKDIEVKLKAPVKVGKEYGVKVPRMVMVILTK